MVEAREKVGGTRKYWESLDGLWWILTRGGLSMAVSSFLQTTVGNSLDSLDFHPHHISITSGKPKAGRRAAKKRGKIKKRKRSVDSDMRGKRRRKSHFCLFLGCLMDENQKPKKIVKISDERQSAEVYTLHNGLLVLHRKYYRLTDRVTDIRIGRRERVLLRRTIVRFLRKPGFTL